MSGLQAPLEVITPLVRAATFRADGMSFGVQLYRNRWVLVADPGEGYPVASEDPAAAEAARQWAYLNRRKFHGVDSRGAC